MRKLQAAIPDTTTPTELAHLPLGLQYQKLLDECGSDSPEALAFRRACPEFEEQADIFDQLRRNRRLLEELHASQESSTGLPL